MYLGIYEYTYAHTYAYLHVIIMRKEAMNLKENNEI